MKAQSASEFMIIISATLVLLLPLIFFLNESLMGFRDDTKITLTENVVNKLGESIDWVYSQGTPARLTLEVYVPDGIVNVSMKNRSIFYEVDTSSGVNTIYYDTIPPINGTLPVERGYYKISLIAFDDYVNISVVE